MNWGMFMLRPLWCLPSVGSLVVAKRFLATNLSSDVLAASKVTTRSRKLRQHVNPLSLPYTRPFLYPSREEWEKSYQLSNFSETTQWHLDVGSGRGGFLRDLSKLAMDRLFLGLDIRDDFVQLSKARMSQSNNLAYLEGNSRMALRKLNDSLPQGKMHSLSILFPDPWFKKRHVKRRMVTEELVSDCAYCLGESANMPSISPPFVLLKSDVRETIDYMSSLFDGCLRFSRVIPNIIDLSDSFQTHPWFLNLSSFEQLCIVTQSDREKYCREKQLPIYLIMYQLQKQ